MPASLRGRRVPPDAAPLRSPDPHPLMPLLRAGLAIALLATSLEAQGKPLAVDGGLLPLQSDTFAVYAIRGADTILTGSVVDVLGREGDQLVRVYSEVTASEVRLDTIVSSLHDLRPLRYITHSSHEFASLVYDSLKVGGLHILADGDSETVASPVPFPVYDGASFDLIARASPLSDTFHLAVPSFVIGPNTVTLLRGRVTGVASVDGHNCWVFRAAFAGMPVTFWIDQSTRALRQQFLQFQTDFGMLYTTPVRTKRSTRVS
jgi:hypothetical protein